MTGKGWGPGRNEPGGRPQQSGRPGLQRARGVSRRASVRAAVRVLVRLERPAPRLRHGVGRQVGHRRRTYPSGARTSRTRARCAKTSPTTTTRCSASIATSPGSCDVLESARRARTHRRDHDRRQRHAVPALQGEPLRLRRARAAGRPLARRAGGRPAGRRVREPHRPCARRCSNWLASAVPSVDDRTQPACR